MSGDGSRLALVLSGGGSKGALQVGLYRALCELEVRPDLIVASSVGALNGALIAAGVGPRTVAEGWRRTSRSELFRTDWSLLWRWTSAQGLFSGPHFRRFLDDHVPARTFEELDIPLHIVATHLTSGEACRLSEGDLREAIHASCAVPGLLPPVALHGGVPHVDGSLGDNLPIAVARELGVRRILAMNCRTCDRCEVADPNLAQTLGRAFSIAADCTLRRMRERYGSDPDVLLLQPELGERIQALDFSQGARLVEEGYRWALPRIRGWVEEDGDTGRAEPRLETGG
ncbi:MAG: patatin-like phospholipase family protein [Gemmatimonadota bacterium]